jgi:hypothetical protein
LPPTIFAGALPLPSVGAHLFRQAPDQRCLCLVDQVLDHCDHKIIRLRIFKDGHIDIAVPDDVQDVFLEFNGRTCTFDLPYVIDGILRVHLRNMGFTTGSFHSRSNPSNVGTKHPGQRFTIINPEIAHSATYGCDATFRPCPSYQ